MKRACCLYIVPVKSYFNETEVKKEFDVLLISSYKIVESRLVRKSDIKL